ncbi:outer membrane beta-barrel protein [Salinarimonas sp.]|uniref:outer membrane protein n=1 Tax=Salinarimonas sp. TaxID=2766526 RepID=UPI0032D90932
MNYVKPAIACAAFVAAGVVFTTAASAADLPLLPEPPPPVAVEAFGGWYLRGDIGVSSQQVDKITNSVLPTPGNSVEFLDQSFDSAGFVGVGVGYRFNNWLRVDVTGEYRAPSSFSGLDRVDIGNDGDFDSTNIWTANKTEYVGLLNLYLDLGTWYGVTPFVGAGAGFAHVQIDDLRDVNIHAPGGSVFYADDGARTNFAWALYAGLGYEASERLSLEVAYRYLSMGDGEAGDLRPYCCGTGQPDKTTFHDLTSHDVKVGMRWNLQGPAPVYGGPISRSF